MLLVPALSFPLCLRVFETLCYAFSYLLLVTHYSSLFPTLAAVSPVPATKVEGGRKAADTSPVLAVFVSFQRHASSLPPATLAHVAAVSALPASHVGGNFSICANSANFNKRCNVLIFLPFTFPTFHF
jgi:hypothetical protein